MIDKTFGRLTVLAEHCRTIHRRRIYECLCTCGQISFVDGMRLRNGETKSCGCLKAQGNHRTHGQSKTRLYEIWSGMKSRCYNPRKIKYRIYGARGIHICNSWRNSFTVFAEWANDHGYRNDLCIDRIDNDGNYCPSNCRWVDRKTQMRNVSYNRILDVRGERLSVAEWADRLNMKIGTLQSRITRGWSPEDAVLLPLKHGHRINIHPVIP